MYKIAICEDDIDYIEYMKKIIVATDIIDSENLLFYDFYSGEELCKVSDFSFDLVIMDMQMDKMDGYETAMRLRELDRGFLLIFVSGVKPPFSRSFKANPFRYLLKEFSEEEMIDEMAEIVTEMKDKKQQPCLVCRSQTKENVKVYPESVVYVCKYRSRSEVHITGSLAKRFPSENLRADRKLDEINAVFNEKCGFVRAHNSYIINMAYITSIQSHYIKLITGEELSYSRARADEFKQAFAQFVAAKY